MNKDSSVHTSKDNINQSWLDKQFMVYMLYPVPVRNIVVSNSVNSNTLCLTNYVFNTKIDWWGGQPRFKDKDKSGTEFARISIRLFSSNYK